MANIEQGCGRGVFGLLWLACVLGAVAIVPAPAQGASEIVLHNFNYWPHGAELISGVVRDPAGNFYGTANQGGKANAGVVFKVDMAGHETVLYRFTGGADGARPYAGVIRDSAGNLYGTTASGGQAGAGVVYKLSPAKQSSGGWQEAVLYSFTGGADGANPQAGVIRDSAGNLYGTTVNGGDPSCNFGVGGGCGVVYKLNTTGQQTVLHTFTSVAEDGFYPYAAVIRDSAGNLYGTTSQGGTAGLGVVYKLDKHGQEMVLYNFTGGTDGGYPLAGVIGDSAGNLYGTTNGGGGSGVVFKLDAQGRETPLYTFTGGADGGEPIGGVILGPNGTLYGATLYGGIVNAHSSGGGVVYSLDSGGHETVLYSFTGGADGNYPSSGVIRDSSGDLYGASEGGGAGGSLYKLDASGHETVMYGFPGAAGGTTPAAGLIRDSAGNLYGTTSMGGTAGAGTIFKLDSAGQETVLYTFAGGADGCYPSAGVIRDSAGNLYGTATWCGPGNAGVVYKLDPAGHLTVLYGFTSGADGGGPRAGVIRDAEGNLYGTTYTGGTSGGAARFGVVYKLDTTGKETVLYNFCSIMPDCTDGGFPESGVIRDSAGNLYGAASSGGPGHSGVVYKLDTTRKYTVLYGFTGADGGSPNGGLIRDSAGNLYGTTYSGGTANAGTVFKLDSANQETVLYSFTGGADGATPDAGVIRDAAGNLYGTTYAGGGGPCHQGTAQPTGCGVVFKLNPGGQETVLYGFTGGTDGGYPLAGVIGDSAGALFGTASIGGKLGGGVVFKIKP
jgi:uncharacterized repeat protein (TIGR03803 family)